MQLTRSGTGAASPSCPAAGLRLPAPPQCSLWQRVPHSASPMALTNPCPPQRRVRPPEGWAYGLASRHRASERDSMSAKRPAPPVAVCRGTGGLA